MVGVTEMRSVQGARKEPPVPRCPAGMDPDAKKIWREVLRRYGAGCEKIAGPALEAFCGQMAMMRKLQKQVDDEGLIVLDSRGAAMRHPAFDMLIDLRKQIQAVSSDFDPPKRRGR